MFLLDTTPLSNRPLKLTKISAASKDFLILFIKCFEIFGKNKFLKNIIDKL